jgi:hypothetical protein
MGMRKVLPATSLYIDIANGIAALIIVVIIKMSRADK